MPATQQGPVAQRKYTNGQAILTLLVNVPIRKVNGRHEKEMASGHNESAASEAIQIPPINVFVMEVWGKVRVCRAGDTTPLLLW